MAPSHASGHFRLNVASLCTGQFRTRRAAKRLANGVPGSLRAMLGCNLACATASHNPHNKEHMKAFTDRVKTKTGLKADRLIKLSQQAKRTFAHVIQLEGTCRRSLQTCVTKAWGPEGLCPDHSSALPPPPPPPHPKPNWRKPQNVPLQSLQPSFQ